MSFGRLGTWCGPVTVALAILAGCGGKGDEAAFTRCPARTARTALRTRRGRCTGSTTVRRTIQPDPAALRAWWNEHVIVEETLLREAPAEIRAAVEVKVSAIRTRMTPLLEMYEFDLKRIEREATAAEKAVLDQPSPEMEQAQVVQYAFEEDAGQRRRHPRRRRLRGRRVVEGLLLGTGRAQRRVRRGRFLAVRPGRVAHIGHRRQVPGDSRRPRPDGSPEIAADVEAETEWFRTRWSGVTERYGYDIRGIYLEGTPEDLAVFNRAHPDVVEHTARDTAYEEQVCGD